MTVVLGVVLLTGLLAFWWSARAPLPIAPAPKDVANPVAMLFDRGVLHHASKPARDLLSLEPGMHFWQDMRDGLLARFPDLPEHPVEGTEGQATYFAIDQQGPTTAQVRWRGTLCWVSLLRPEERAKGAVDNELRALRRVRASAPDPSWQVNRNGHVIWYNQAYEMLFRQLHDKPVDPQTSLFRETTAGPTDRVLLNTDDGKQTDWYQLTTVNCSNVTVYHATCINAVAEAEEAQRNFVQTLAKTFAHLSIGLAIFDRDGQLKIFNPALVDLSGLPAHFLSSRPTMLSFFDQLRESRRMPEPKNYHTWREEIAGVIAAATDGTYQETWTLESGQTYSVKGRPHPDGATAFLIEDISAEMTLTRNFRAELEQGQMLLDTVEEPMVVFSPSGVLTFSNDAYRRMWNVDPDASFADVMIRDSTALWQQRFGRSAVWRSIEEFVTDFGERNSWEVSVGQINGVPTLCYMLPLPSGATMVQFRNRQIPQRRPQKEMSIGTG